MRRILLLGLLALVMSLVAIGVAPPASATVTPCEYGQVNQYWVRQCTVPVTEMQCQQVTYSNPQGVNVVVIACVPTRVF